MEDKYSRLLLEAIDLEDEDQNYLRLYDLAYEDTDNFSASKGSITVEDFTEAEILESILKEHYADTSTTEGDGSFKVKYSKLAEEKLKLASWDIFRNPDPSKFIGNIDGPTGSSASSTGTMSFGEDYTDDLQPEIEPKCAYCDSSDVSHIGGQGDYEEYVCDNCEGWSYLDPYTNEIYTAEEAWGDPDEKLIAQPVEDIGDEEEVLTDVAVESEELSEAIEKHDELNPKLFSGDTLKPEVRTKLLEIVERFVNYLKDDGLEIDIKDIILVGSNTSYNYTDQSDIDLHILADMGIYEDSEELAEKLYNAYRQLWNYKYDPLIYGHEVEIFVEPPENYAVDEAQLTEAVSNGVYSLNRGWIKVPNKETIPNEVDISNQLNELIEKARYCTTVEEIDEFIDSLYVLRQTSILNDGEYGEGNLLFKELRNLGILSSLKEKKIKLLNDEMSLF